MHLPIIKFGLSSLLLFCTFGIKAQTIEVDFQKIVDKIDSSKMLTLSVNVSVFAKKGGSKIYSTKASVERNRNASKSVLGEMEYYSDDNYQIEIDHEERGVLILKKEESKQKTKKEKLDVDVETLKAIFEKNEGEIKVPVVKIVSNTKSIRTYSITNVDGFKEIQMQLDMSKCKILKITYEYPSDGESNGQYIVLDYSVFSYSAPELNTTLYFNLVKGNVVLASRLKGYSYLTD